MSDEQKNTRRSPANLFAVALRMDKALHARLKAAALKSEQSLTAEIIERLENSLDSDTDSPTDFGPTHASAAWSSLADIVSAEFLSVNYLSVAAWRESLGDSICLTIGARMRRREGRARRIFVLDNLDERGQWESVWEVHRHPAAQVQAKFILLSDYEKLRQLYIEDNKQSDADMVHTVGFVVIDQSHLAEWHYDTDRRAQQVHVTAADPAKAMRFRNFFSWVWAHTYSQICD